MLKKIIILYLAASTNCYAYIDGQLTLVLLQIVLALIGGLIVFIKNPFETVKKIIKKFIINKIK
jgi:hypothetical protein